MGDARFSPDTYLCFRLATWELKVAWRQNIIVLREPEWADVDYEFKKASTRRLAHEIINDVAEAHFEALEGQGRNGEPEAEDDGRSQMNFDFLLERGAYRIKREDWEIELQVRTVHYARDGTVVVEVDCIEVRCVA